MIALSYKEVAQEIGQGGKPEVPAAHTADKAQLASRVHTAAGARLSNAQLPSPSSTG